MSARLVISSPAAGCAPSGIANALAWPERIDSGVDSLNLLQVGQLDFTEADEARYPCLTLARQAWRQGGSSMAVLNAANEVAVEHFLARHIRFTEISSLITEVMERTSAGTADDLAAILDADAAARRLARELIKVRA